MEEPLRLAYIYVLLDPQTGEMRYIGSSTHPRRRLQDHLAAARAHHQLRSLGRTRWKSTVMATRQPPTLCLRRGADHTATVAPRHSNHPITVP
jgi:hypothetical protein